MKPLMHWLCDWRLILLTVLIILTVKLFIPVSWWIVVLPIIFPIALLTFLGAVSTIGVVVGMLGRPKMLVGGERKKEKKSEEDEQ
jgi:hypothetical protein